MSWDPPRRQVGRLDSASLPRRTLVDKVWDAHLVATNDHEGLDRLSVDRILLHEQQVGLLGRARGGSQRVSDPGRIVACADQQVPTAPPTDGWATGAQSVSSIERLEMTSAALGMPMFGPGDHRGGVVNVVASEQGMVLPGNLVVGADSHLSTQGALGALAMVIGDDEVAEVVDSGTVLRERPGVVRVTISGSMSSRVSSKDLALWLFGRLGPDAGAGRVLELGGPVVRSLSVEARMTLCNLAVEGGAVSVLIAPDEITADYLEGRPFVPTGSEWRRVAAGWGALASDLGASFYSDLVLLGDDLGPQATWGTDICQVAPLDGVVPEPSTRDRARAELDRRALVAQDLVPGTSMSSIEVDQVFIGSCANARIEDIRAAAAVIRGGRATVCSWVVPGSWPVKHQAEAEGLHRIFKDAGVEWRDPGCSLCIGANGDAVRPGQRLASTANRPARGLVGPGARVHLLSPASAAATALSGRLSSPESRTGA